MAHEIHHDELTDTDSFVSVKQSAWHGLGTVVQEAMTAADAIKLANLDYEVDKVAAQANIPMPSGDVLTDIPDRFATYRKDTGVILGEVGKIYEIVQNKDAFGFFDAIIDDGEAIFETAGVLGKGERIFVTAKLPEDMLVNGEACNKYIVLTNSHNGSSSIIAGFTNVRVVCMNTLQVALRGLENKVAIQHKLGAKERLQEAYKVMGICSSYMTEVQGIFTQMANTRIEEEKLRVYIHDVMKAEYINPNKPPKKDGEESAALKNKVDSIFDFAMNHPTQQTDAVKGTVFGAYNAISGYYNYIKSWKSEEHKFASQQLGFAGNKIAKGFQKAFELI